MSRSMLRRSCRRRHQGNAGFTLVELMVALTGGLIFSVAVFALSRDTSRFYQREARVADATLAAIIGFERLQADIARAGYMMSPNPADDPMFCGTAGEANAWPSIMSGLVGLSVTPGGSTQGTDRIEENLERYPDSLLLAGNYTSVDGYAFVGVDQAGGGARVSLRASSGGLARAGYLALDATAQTTLLARLFPANRILRIVDEYRREQYGIITQTAAGAIPTISLANSPPLRFRGGTATVCGLSPRSTGTVNVVNFIRYSIRSVSGDANFAALFSAAAAAVPGEATRTELVREELFPLTGAPDPATVELIAEYAVDLEFGATVGLGAPGNPVTQLQTFPAGSAIAALTPTDGNYAPQRVRALRTRFSVRSREPDRMTNVTTAAERAALGLTDGLYRFGVGAEGGPPFARVRTLQADIALHNQSGVEW